MPSSVHITNQRPLLVYDSSANLLLDQIFSEVTNQTYTPSNELYVSDSSAHTLLNSLLSTSNGTLWYNDAVGNNVASSSISVSEFGTKVTIFGNNTGFDSLLTVQYSIDQNIWYSSTNLLLATAGSDYSLDFTCAAPYIRVMNSTATVITLNYAVAR